MRLNHLHEAGKPNWDYSKEEAKHGDLCPKCGQRLTNKYTKMGKPSFVGCKNFHAYRRATGEPAGRGYQMFDPEKFWHDYNVEVEKVKAHGPRVGEAHSCGVESARGAPLAGSNLERWYRQHADDCHACDHAYDTLLDQEMGDLPYAGDDLESVGEKSQSFDELLDQLLKKVDPRAGHVPGEFGTGRPEAIKPTDSKVVKAIKAIRDLGYRRGESGEIVIGDYKDRCGWEHTCREHPSGYPAWNFPMPDPVLTGDKKKTQGFNMFRYAPESTLEWPRSGAVGYEPKGEFETYVFSKLRCPVCSGGSKGCVNPVAHEYGKPKPYCTEHMLSAPYPQELMRKYGGEGLPDQPEPTQDYRSSEKKFRETQGKLLERGDRVRLGKELGTVLEVDPEMEDRTHRVQWDNPRTKALEITWVDPEDLDLVE